MRAIVDAGPLVALIDRAERHHRWAVEHAGMLDPPLLACEPVVTEAMYLLASRPRGADWVLGLVEDGVVAIAFGLGDEVARVHKLIQRYRDRPMSLADACVVRMAERFDDHAVFTLDSDFTFYRKNGRTPIRLIHPTLS